MDKEIALKILRELHDKALFSERTALETLHPELAESEDEKIRKEIINYFKCQSRDEPSRKAIHNIWIYWLEKQGEQKETLCDKCKKAQPSHSCQDITALGRCYIEGMNASNKVEPKFKVGDWIVFNGLTLYVKEVVKGFYRTVSKGGIPNSYDWAIDNTARVWTIQEAMDGDVIQLGEVTAIFRDFIGNGHCKCYCSVCNGEFEIPSQEGDDSYGCYNAAPATKEQRELLFTKMKEEGYEWDAENKELKKENLSDFESALFTAFSDAWQQYLLGEKVNVTQWVKEHSSELIEIAKQNDKTIA